MNNSKEFGRIVRRYRNKLKLSQEHFAHKAGIHRTYIGSIETGRRNPTLIMIYRLAKALKVRPQDLLPN